MHSGLGGIRCQGPRSGTGMCLSILRVHAGSDVSCAEMVSRCAFDEELALVVSGRVSSPVLVMSGGARNNALSDMMTCCLT